jgi:hypothetical protein
MIHAVEMSRSFDSAMLWPLSLVSPLRTSFSAKTEPKAELNPGSPPRLTSAMATISARLA